MSSADDASCWLCGRPLGEVVQYHHPVPKSRGGRATVRIHPICHRTLHRTFSNAQLALFGDSVAAIRADPRIGRFLNREQAARLPRSDASQALVTHLRRAYDAQHNRGALHMRHAILLIACALPLAACNKSPEVHEKDASVGEVAKKVREAGADQSMVRPGLWESKVTIDQFDMPGVPAEMAQRMKTMMAQNQPHGFQTCLTPEDVRRPKEDFFAGKDNECRYEHFTMGGGKIDAAMRCGGHDGTQVMQMAGTYSPDSYQMQTSMTVEGGDKAESGMSMKMRIEATRVGECTGKAG